MRILSPVAIILYTSLLMLATVESRAQDVEDWFVRYDGPGHSLDGANRVVLDNAGNIYMAGGCNAVDHSTAMCTIKCNSQGDTLWTAIYDWNVVYDDVIEDMVVDEDLNVYVTGHGRDANDDYDFCTIKYNSIGDTLWLRHYNGPTDGWDYALSLGLDRWGNVYVGGWSWNDGNEDFLVVKYSSTGDSLWTARFDGPDSNRDEATCMAVDADGNSYITGKTWYNGTWDYCTVKITASGDTAWSVLYNGLGNNTDEPHAIAVDASGNVCVTGYSFQNGAVNFDMLTIKYSPSGDSLWAARYDGPMNLSDNATDITVDDAGNVYVTGYDWHGASSQGGSGEDYCTIKYSPDGIERWVSHYSSGSCDDEAYAVAVDNEGNVYVTGRTFGATGTYKDMGTVMYDSAGQELWSAWFNGEEDGEDYATDIAVNEAGEIFVTGRSYSDMCLVKYTPSFAGCCVGMVGNIDCSFIDTPDMGDLTVMIDHLFISLMPLCCIEEADVDLSGQPDPVDFNVDTGDLTVLIDHLFISLTPLPLCP